MGSTLSIPARFNGPLESGNGGYCSGVFAALIDGPAAVNLRRPIPLDAPLDVVRAGGEAHVRSGGEVIAEAQPAPRLAVEPPEPPAPDVARKASDGYRGAESGTFSECFVCGRGRADSLEVFAGAVEGRRLVASAWTPPAWTGGEDGGVRPEVLWAVLDCPTVPAAFVDSEVEPFAFLVRMQAELRAPVPVGREHVVCAWPTSRDGRKHRACSAVFSAGGELLAAAEALMIEPVRDTAAAAEAGRLDDRG